MYDPIIGKVVPVVGVNVLAYNGLRIKQTYTDSLGNFKLGGFSGDNVRFWIKWEHKDELFDIRSNGFGQAFTKGPKHTQKWNAEIKGGKDGFRALIYKAAADYVHSDVWGKNVPFKRVSMKAYAKRRNLTGPDARYTPFTQNLQVWGKGARGFSFVPFYVYAATIHELGHADHDQFYSGGSHYAKVEKRLRESWSEGVKYLVTASVYPDTMVQMQKISKQYPKMHPWRNTDWGEKQSYFQNYSPLIIDLVDTISLLPIKDKVSGYTLKQIKDVMSQPDCVGFNALNRMLKQQLENPTEQHLDVLFEEMNEKK